MRTIATTVSTRKLTVHVEQPEFDLCNIDLIQELKEDGPVRRLQLIVAATDCDSMFQQNRAPPHFHVPEREYLEIS